MAKKGTRAGIALSIAGLVGGTYRLVSAYGGGALPDVLVPPAFLDSNSGYDLTEVSSPAGGSTSESNWQEPTTDSFTREESSSVATPVKPVVALNQGDEDETIAMEFPCFGRLWENGELSQNIDFLFRWELGIDGKNDKAKLKAKKTITKEATISVTRQDNNKVLWNRLGSGDENIRGIETKWNTTGTIEVTLISWVKGVMNVVGNDKGGSLQETSLYCKNTGLSNGWKKILYRDGDLGQESFKKIPMTLQVSLGQCVDKENGKEQKCDLRIISGKLQWKSTRFETKVTLSTNKK